jgi:predicted metal-dependent enzyme (double-stranded beta helix superfamily)
MTDVRDVTNSPENGIQPLTTQQLSTLVGQLAARPDVWLPHLRLPESRQRWWTQLRSDPLVDVWLLSWLPGHATDLHDHGPSAAAFVVVRGELNEVRIAPGGRRISVPRRRGSTTALGVGVVHDVRGAGSRPAVSIHAYSPPLERMTYYEIDQRGRLRGRSTLETHEPEQLQNG